MVKRVFNYYHIVHMSGQLTEVYFHTQLLMVRQNMTIVTFMHGL